MSILLLLEIPHGKALALSLERANKTNERLQDEKSKNQRRVAARIDYDLCC